MKRYVLVEFDDEPLGGMKRTLDYLRRPGMRSADVTDLEAINAHVYENQPAYGLSPDEAGGWGMGWHSAWDKMLERLQ